jgi:hypothetical protein
MHPLYDYIANQIADRLKERRVVVMYDKREELRPFFTEMLGGASDGVVAPVIVGQRAAKGYVFDGSFLKTRFTVEDATGGDQPDEIVIYIPGLERDAKGSLLMELEKAGTYYAQPALKQFARLVLRKRFTDVAIDEMLKADSLTYTDLARMAQDEAAAEGASLLKGVFRNSDTTAILTEWIAEPKNDGDLETKGALGELRAAVLARLGIRFQMTRVFPKCGLSPLDTSWPMSFDPISERGLNLPAKWLAHSRTFLRQRAPTNKRPCAKSPSGSASVMPQLMSISPTG